MPTSEQGFAESVKPIPAQPIESAERSADRAEGTRVTVMTPFKIIRIEPRTRMKNREKKPPTQI